MLGRGDYKRADEEKRKYRDSDIQCSDSCQRVALFLLVGTVLAAALTFGLWTVINTHIIRSDIHNLETTCSYEQAVSDAQVRIVEIASSVKCYVPKSNRCRSTQDPILIDLQPLQACTEIILDNAGLYQLCMRPALETDATLVVDSDDVVLDLGEQLLARRNASTSTAPLIRVQPTRTNVIIRNGAIRGARSTAVVIDQAFDVQLSALRFQSNVAGITASGVRNLILREILIRGTTSATEGALFVTDTQLVSISDLTVTASSITYPVVVPPTNLTSPFFSRIERPLAVGLVRFQRVNQTQVDGLRITANDIVAQFGIHFGFLQALFSESLVVRDSSFEGNQVLYPSYPAGTTVTIAQGVFGNRAARVAGITTVSCNIINIERTSVSGNLLLGQFTAGVILNAGANVRLHQVDVLRNSVPLPEVFADASDSIGATFLSVFVGLGTIDITGQVEFVGCTVADNTIAPFIAIFSGIEPVSATLSTRNVIIRGCTVQRNVGGTFHLSFDLGRSHFMLVEDSIASDDQVDVPATPNRAPLLSGFYGGGVLRSAVQPSPVLSRSNIVMRRCQVTGLQGNNLLAPTFSMLVYPFDVAGGFVAAAETDLLGDITMEQCTASDNECIDPIGQSVGIRLRGGANWLLRECTSRSHRGNATVIGISGTDTQSTITGGPTIVFPLRNVFIEGCVVQDNWSTTSGATTGISLIPTLSTTNIENIVIRNCVVQGNNGTSSSIGIDLLRGRNAVIKGCNVKGNALTSGASGTGIRLRESLQSQVVDNVLLGNIGTGIEVTNTNPATFSTSVWRNSAQGHTTSFATTRPVPTVTFNQNTGAFTPAPPTDYDNVAVVIV